jgi:CHAD domain-containing protein
MAFARVQEVLGDHQDGVVARGWLAKAAGESSANEAYALGMLAAVEQRADAAARAAFPAVWAKAAKPKLRRWLG